MLTTGPDPGFDLWVLEEPVCRAWVTFFYERINLVFLTVALEVEPGDGFLKLAFEALSLSLSLARSMCLCRHSLM